MSEALNLAKRRVALDEGCELSAYQDSLGVWTIGYGTNLQTLTIDADLAQRWLEEKIAIAEGDARAFFGNFDQLDPVRQSVLINMAYQLGATRLSKWKNFKAAVAHQDWPAAAESLHKSRMYSQVPKRLDRHRSMLLTGQFIDS